MANTKTEGGLRDHRLEFDYESTEGSLETNGTFEPFSNEITGVTWTPDGQIDARRGLGNVDPYGHDRGPETHELTNTFRLQGTIEATFYTNSVATKHNHPVWDAMARDADGLMYNTYTIVEREKFNSGGVNDTGYRVYTVAQGGKPNSVPIPGDPGDGQPAEVEIPYQCEKVRSYRIDQPQSDYDSSIAVTGPGSVGTVVIQDDAGATESITGVGGGTTKATYAGSYIDAVYLTNEASQQVNIQGYGTFGGGTAGSVGATLMTIKGSEDYDDLEGDRGVPFGSHFSGPQHGTAFQHLVGDTINWAGDDLAFGISSVELSVDNNTETTPRQGLKRQRVFAGERTIQQTATVYGKDESHDKIMAHLQNKTGTIEWNMTSNVITVNGASLIDSPDRSFESGQAFMELDNTFEGTGLTINGTAV